MLSLKKLKSAVIIGALAVTALGGLTSPVAAQRPAVQQNGTLSYGQAGFVGEPINLNVVKADIRELLNYITTEYGVNFVIDQSVGKVEVTVNVNDVPWNLALDAVLKANGLGVEVNGSILRVAAVKTLAEERAIQQEIANSRLDGSTLYTEYLRLNYASACNSSSGPQFVGGIVDNGDGKSVGVDTGAAGGGQGSILPIIRRRLSRRGGIECEPRSNTLIITDVRENIDAVRQLISLLDQPEPQVEVEARVVVATRSFTRDLGVQLRIASDIRGGNGTVFGGTQPTDTNGTPTFPIANPNLTSAQTVVGLVLNAFGTAQISAVLQAGERKGQAKVIASPRITAMNNQEAEIVSGSQIPVVTAQAGGASGGGSGAAGGQLFTTTFVSVPLRLSVKPRITDAGTVLMDVVTENNSVDTSFNNSTGTPGINTQKMKTTVLVPDGGTTIVGGAIIDNEGETRSRTPGLSGIPILGNLFKTKNTSRSTSEVLFFITPRIYRPDYQGNPTSGVVNPNGNRSTTLIQPVPLGNPATNSTDINGGQPNNPNFPAQGVPAAVPTGSVDNAPARRP